LDVAQGFKTRESFCFSPYVNSIDVFEHRENFYISGPDMKNGLGKIRILDHVSLVLIDKFDGMYALAHNDYLYFTNFNGMLSIRNVANKYEKIKNISLCMFPQKPMISKNNLLFIISSKNLGTILTIVDISDDHKVIKTIPMSDDAKLEFFHGNYLFILNTKEGTISVMELTRFRITDTIEVGPVYTYHLCNNRYLCVLNERIEKEKFIGPGAQLTVVDIDRHFKTKIIPLGFRPHGDMLSHGRYLYLIDREHGSVARLDPSKTEIEHFRVGKNPEKISPYGDYLFVINSESRTISVIDTSEIPNAKSFNIGVTPLELLFLDNLYVISKKMDTIKILDIGGFSS
jgi:YVTN family beta-propeller protein